MGTILGIISDTHGEVAYTRMALSLFKKQGVQEILHCGDIGTAEIVGILSELPTHYVFGNTDSRDFLRNAILRYEQTCYESVGMLAREGKRIVWLHGDDWRTYDELLKSGRFDLICSGHTHEAKWELQGKTYLLNPGALARTVAPSVAILTLPEMSLQTKRI